MKHVQISSNVHQIMKTEFLCFPCNQTGMAKHLYEQSRLYASGCTIYVIDIMLYMLLCSQKEEPKPTTTAASGRPAGSGRAVKVLLVIATVWLIITVAVMVTKIIIS